jgi:hypothetical protein
MSPRLMVREPVLSAVRKTAGDPHARMSLIRERLAATSQRDRDLRVMLVLSHELLRRGVALGEALQAAEQRAAVSPAQGSGGAVDDYEELVRHIHAMVATKLPGGTKILVVSRGDESLFVPSFDMSHFPQGPNGIYAGYYPADSDAAVADLERCRAAGAQFLLLPATGFWWLDYYGGLLQHLILRGRVFHHDDHCLIFDLRASSERGGPEQ